jgi:hypothetical protein
LFVSRLFRQLVMRGGHYRLPVTEVGVARIMGNPGGAKEKTFGPRERARGHNDVAREKPDCGENTLHAASETTREGVYENQPQHERDIRQSDDEGSRFEAGQVN